MIFNRSRVVWMASFSELISSRLVTLQRYCIMNTALAASPRLITYPKSRFLTTILYMKGLKPTPWILSVMLT